MISLVNDLETRIAQSDRAVQGGTPMTVTGNGASPSNRGRSVFIFCPKISSGVRGWKTPGAGNGNRCLQ